MSKINYFTLLIFVICSSQIKSELSQENIVAAINCGGDSYKDSRGIIYEKVILNNLII